MKYIATVSLAVICASPAFAGASRGGSCTGSIVASAVNAGSVLEHSAFDNASMLSSNKTSVSAAMSIMLNDSSVLNGGLGLSHGCVCS